MPLDITDASLHAQFISAWENLTGAAEACRTSILRDAPLPCWGWRAETFSQARAEASDILTRFVYTDDQPSRESVIYPAVLGASEKTLRLAAQLNVHKDRVRNLLKAMDDRLVTENIARGKTRTLTAQVLAHEGLMRLHRMQVYRHVRLIHQRPDRIALGWARTRRVKRCRATDIQTMLKGRLRRAAYPGLILADMERLTYLGSGESLALVDQEPVHVRANLAWLKKDAPGWLRRQVTLALPMLFTSRPGQMMPALKPLPNDADTGGSRVRRGGRVLEPEPFLRTLPVYRYREEYRSGGAAQSPV